MLSIILKYYRLNIQKEHSGFPLCAIREIKFLKTLNHNNIVKLQNVVTSKGYQTNDTFQNDKKSDQETINKDGESIFKLSGNLYFVFEFVEHDLGGLIDSKYEFSTISIKFIMKQLFEVLEYLHDKKIIHRDIKSSNILIKNNFIVKLADFGLARSLPHFDDKIELTNNVITLWYRPPELLLGSTNYSSSIDIWSVGCVFAELELYRPIFPGKSEPEQLEIIFRYLGSPNEESWPEAYKYPYYDKLMKPLTIYNSNIKLSFASKISESSLGLLERLLVKDPSKRYSARSALSDRYFLTRPLPPSNPEDLEPMKFDINTSFHEYKTKMTRKKNEEEARKKEKY